MEISVICGIDFTKSNGNPLKENSLHYAKDPSTLNHYQKAITSVCSILLNYDSDKLIQTYGFGAIPHFQNMNSNEVSHFFPCSGDFENCAGFGIKGVFDLYNTALMNIEFKGPTYFTPFLTEIIKFARNSYIKNPQNYTVVLIMTDGEINDMDSTIDMIVEASFLPLSVIIVGIGNGDFKNMEILDGDDQILKNSKGISAQRDIVQFVPFRNFENSEDIGALAEAVLEELPRQVVDFYKIKTDDPLKSAL